MPLLGTSPLAADGDKLVRATTSHLLNWAIFIAIPFQPPDAQQFYAVCLQSKYLQPIQLDG